MEFNIPHSIKKVMRIMKKNGFESYLVGGCVRDFMMGKQPSDFDITTNARPEQTKACFSEYKVIETGIKHGTVTVLIDKEPVEITTFRIDGKYTDNRHPESVEFTVKLSDDLSRRDFTVNALALDEDGEITDLFSGKNDLENKIIRCVGNADKRFEEDGLRILRALRFASVLDFRIEASTAESIIRNKKLLLNISKERILSELTKLLCGVNAEKILNEFREVFEVVLPEVAEYKEYETYTKALSKTEPEKNQRFAALLSGCENPADILKKLKSDNRTSVLVNEIVRDFRGEIKEDDIFIKKMLISREFSQLICSVELKRAFGEETEKCDRIISIINRIDKNNECVKLSQLDISGNDILNNGIATGKHVGTILFKLLNDIIEGKVKNEKAELLKMAKRLKSST